ncbi:MAG TPA: SNF2-related protein [Pirellulales bacterium]|jgi:SNF2 family DNA or RNA helicase|nr:SNF2-related protein [Pirellulales bacterium]
MADLLQCPICARQLNISRCHPGRKAKCPCGYRLQIPEPSEAKRLAPLRLPTRAPRSIAPVPVDWPRRRQFAPSGGSAANGAALRGNDRLPRLAEPLAGPPLHPVVGAILQGRLVDLDTIELLLLAERLALESGFDKLRAPALLRNLRLHDYQERTVKHVLRQLGGRALLADEVGLGKTIEAGCIIKELCLRGLVKKVLILTPATLVTQWQGELRDKFSLPFEIGGNRRDWKERDLIIASLDTAKGNKHAVEIQEIPWGLVVIDEAHRLKNRRTRNWKFVNAIRSRYLLLLSATPFQNDLVELYNLVTILRPGQLYTDREFREKFLVKGDRCRCRDPAELKQLLAQVMVRNRRGEVGIKFAERASETRRIEMTAEQQALYDAAIQFCRRWFPAIYGLTAPLVTLGYLKMLCGSPFRFRESLANNILPKVRERPDPQLERDVKELIRKADAVKLDVKLESLVQDLRSHTEKVVLFTQYRGVLSYIAARLRGEGMSLVEFHGGLSAAEKDRAVEAFRGETRIFLATDAGSEGRNLQFARRLVNYDLPWNPMKIEQRIGRVHRLGQEKKVLVTSYTLQGTLEDKLLDLLERKLNLFRLVVGEVEMILGRLKLEQEIAKMFLESGKNDEFTERLERFGEELATLRTDYERHKGANEEVLAGMGAVGDDKKTK